MIKVRPLAHSEIPCIWQIDRKEIIDDVYYLRHGKLVLESEHYDMQGWPPGEPEHYTPFLLDCFDHGGYFWGAFEDEKIIGAVVLENRFIGSIKDTVQMKFLHISKNFRGQGLGKKLFLLAAEKARELGAKKMYISATESKHTVEFYLSLGCALASEIDPQLFELEPNDIHLEYALTNQS